MASLPAIAATATATRASWQNLFVPRILIMMSPVLTTKTSGGYSANSLLEYQHASVIQVRCAKLLYFLDWGGTAWRGTPAICQIAAIPVRSQLFVSGLATSLRGDRF